MTSKKGLRIGRVEGIRAWVALLLLVLGACHRREEHLVRFEGNLGQGARRILGFGFAPGTKGRGRLGFIFVFEPRMAPEGPCLARIGFPGYFYHDEREINCQVALHTFDSRGKSVSDPDWMLHVSKKDLAFRLGNVAGTPQGGNIAYIGIDEGGSFILLRQIAGPAELDLSLESAADLIDRIEGRGRPGSQK